MHKCRHFLPLPLNHVFHSTLSVQLRWDLKVHKFQQGAMQHPQSLEGGKDSHHSCDRFGNPPLLRPGGSPGMDCTRKVDKQRSQPWLCCCAKDDWDHPMAYPLMYNWIPFGVKLSFIVIFVLDSVIYIYIEKLNDQQVFQLIHVYSTNSQVEISQIDSSRGVCLIGLMPWFLTPFALCSSTSVL